MELQVRFCRRSYDGKRYVWTDFPTNNYEMLSVVTGLLREEYERNLKRKEGSGATMRARSGGGDV